MTAEGPRFAWFKSSYSGPQNNSCVEARFTARGMDVRDSKDRSGPQLSFDSAAWRRFLDRFTR